MKIALTNAFLPNQSKGGVPYQVHYLANALTRRGHDVTVFTFSPPPPECEYKVHQYPRPRILKSRQALCTFLMAERLAKTDFRGFDVVHCSGDNYRMTHPHIRTFYGSARDEAAAAVRFRRRAYQNVIAKLEEVGARKAAINIGISQATRARIPAITEIIPCGVDLSAFQPGPKSETPVLLFVGTTGGRKRGQFLAEIFEKEIRPAHPNAILWTVTDVPIEGDSIKNWGKLSLPDLAALYRAAWVFCLPSTYEGFGVPYIEAMASGTPAVAYPNAGAKEVLANGRYGLVAEDNQLGSAINSLLSSPSLREEYRTKGLARAQEFSWERVVDQYETVFQRMLPKQPDKVTGVLTR